MSTRVLVVDDTVVFRRLISDALAGVPGIELAGTASNGRLALSRMAALQPDLITLDIEMPEMNGLQVLEAMRASGSKTGVIMVSSLTSRGGQMTVQALELGAFDFITKPDRGTAQENLNLVRTSLIPKIQAFQRSREIRSILNGRTVNRPPAEAPPKAVRSGGQDVEPPVRSPKRTGSPIVLIGVSTGGPSALAKLLPTLPADLGAPILIVQHMPPLFTEPLAASLQAKSSIQVKEAVDGEQALANCAYIAPGGRQMKIMPGQRGEIVIRISDDPPEQNCRPSVDYLFRSVAMNFPGRAVATILTGMGADGTHGLRLMKRAGCFSIAQDESSCVVFGMPREAIAAGVVDTVLPLDMIGGAIVRSVRETA